ncbi:MAG: MerR family transcriptional regulator [Chitinophagaceae bacterium]
MAFKQIAFAFDDIPEEEIKQPPVKEGKAIVVKEEQEPLEVPLPVFEKKKTDNKKTTRGRMRLKDMDTGVDLIEVPNDEELFKKLYYPIGMVAEMFKVNQSLIRFWENEFVVLKPKKNGKGDRLFRPEDIKNLQLIYHLLRERKYTLEGAKEFLKNNKKADEKFALIESLKKTKAFLNELKANL